MLEKSVFLPSSPINSGNADSIERNGKHILVIREISATPWMKSLAWLIAAAIPVALVTGIATSQPILIVVILTLLLLILTVTTLRQARTEVNLTDRTIVILRRVGTYEWRRVYPLDSCTVTEIRDDRRMIEGYTMPYFTIQLICRGNRIALYSTDSPDKAKEFQATIASFLADAGLSTQQQRPE